MLDLDLEDIFLARNMILEAFLKYQRNIQVLLSKSQFFSRKHDF